MVPADPLDLAGVVPGLKSTPGVFGATSFDSLPNGPLPNYTTEVLPFVFERNLTSIIIFCSNADSLGWLQPLSSKEVGLVQCF